MEEVAQAEGPSNPTLGSVAPQMPPKPITRLLRAVESQAPWCGGGGGLGDLAFGPLPLRSG